MKIGIASMMYLGRKYHVGIFRWVNGVIVDFLGMGACMILAFGSPCLAALDARDMVQKGSSEFGLQIGWWQVNDLFNNEPSHNRSAIFFLPKGGAVVTDELPASWLSGNVEIFLEPLAAHFFQPFNASAFGGTFNFKYNFLSFGRWMPYWEGGGGMLWTDYAPRIPELSTQTNFVLQTGPGIHYFLTEELALTGGLRFNHISNSGNGNRNIGLNAWLINFGFSFFVP